MDVFSLGCRVLRSVWGYSTFVGMGALEEHIFCPSTSSRIPMMLGMYKEDTSHWM